MGSGNKKITQTNSSTSNQHWCSFIYGNKRMARNWFWQAWVTVWAFGDIFSVGNFPFFFVCSTCYPNLTLGNNTFCISSCFFQRGQNFKMRSTFPQSIAKPGVWKSSTDDNFIIKELSSGSSQFMWVIRQGCSAVTGQIYNFSVTCIIVLTVPIGYQNFRKP